MKLKTLPIILMEKDFTDYALSIGVWETLTGGDKSIKEVEIQVINTLETKHGKD
jgi:hypothetical protein